ncbi:Swt1 family HEPN domain-containing protein [Sinorhizobium medicae]|uniref:Swt1 family HEPN domain-containing protein n=1 Tax=Sinorhizobium medicae TaxID=110321 RepID=UPI0011AA670B|nr:Swt1 family HEPN domain-containing protein [Sinorhizobium medicae]MDX1071077.1 hypothetical protein [Sinorhizobium medicae]MDX1200149.1 hypothetical protein [Sinorhizobium medicae]MDX1225430.1 hypothetical protein [Sinorhizobium medicae]MDX1249933.1 hypothetical protein [Sinorhizobium medicae]TWA27698.1 hypothetical protein FB007_12637 [Sinorhizobium medicae]
MSNELKKLLEQQRALQDLAGIGSLGKTIEDATRLHGLNDLQTRISKMATIPNASALALAAMGKHNALGELAAGRMRGLAELGESIRALKDRLIFPEISALSKMLQDYQSEHSKAFREAAGGIESLTARMEAMKTPWLDVQQHALSARAFVDLQAIGGLANSMNSFSARISAALRMELGDWRDTITFDAPALIEPVARFELYDAQGFDANLAHFSVEAYQETVQIAGLALQEDAEADIVFEDDAGVELNSRAYETLLRFEREVRAFIVAVMTKNFGADWMKRQLPPHILDQWKDKKHKDMQRGGDDLPLIDYADFADYKGIIERNDNWEAVFKPVFGRKEDIRESLQRLFPVRIATMHARFITLEDDLYLRAETTRILMRLRRHMS